MRALTTILALIGILILSYSYFKKSSGKKSDEYYKRLLVTKVVNGVAQISGKHKKDHLNTNSSNHENSNSQPKSDDNSNYQQPMSFAEISKQNKIEVLRNEITPELINEVVNNFQKMFNRIPTELEIFDILKKRKQKKHEAITKAKEQINHNEQEIQDASENGDTEKLQEK